MLFVWLGVFFGSQAVSSIGKMLAPPLTVWITLLTFSVQYLVGVVVWMKWYKTEIDVFSLRGWRLGLAVNCGIWGIMLTLAKPEILPVFGTAAGFLKLAYYLLVIGLMEEIWFRGIWFAMFPGRPVAAVFASSLLFGLAHLGFQGPLSVVITFAVGLVFAAARYRGASIGSLVLAHGFNDWINSGVVVDWHWRELPRRPVMTVGCMLLAAAIWKWGCAAQAPSQASGAEINS